MFGWNFVAQSRVLALICTGPFLCGQAREPPHAQWDRPVYATPTAVRRGVRRVAGWADSDATPLLQDPPPLLRDWPSSRAV